MALRPAFRGRRRRGPAALPQRGSRVRRRAADLQPRRLRGRALRQRRPRGDPLPAPQRLDRRRRVRDLDRRRADPADDHRRADLLGRHGAAPRPPRRTSPPAAEDGRGTLEAGGRELGVPARLDRQPAVRDRRRRASSTSSTWARSGPGSKATSSSRTAPTSPSCAIDGEPGAGADLRARGGGDALLRHRRQRRRRHRLPRAAPPSPLVVELEGGELQVEIGEDLAVRLDGWAEPVFAGELSPELLQALAELDGEYRLRGRGSHRFPRPWASPTPQAPGGHPSVQVPGTRAADRRQARCRDRRDQPRDRRPRRTDLPARRRGDAGGGRRPRLPPVPEQPRPRRVPQGLRRLLRPSLRRRDRPEDRGDPGDRRQGVHLQPLLRLPRPGRRRARLRSRLPGLHRRPDPRRRQGRAAAAGAGAGLRPRPRAPSRPTSPPGRG